MRKLVFTLAVLSLAVLAWVLVAGGSRKPRSGVAPDSSPHQIVRQTWTSQPGVMGRRVAGHVRKGTTPVPNARVELRSQLGLAGKQVLARSTDGAGAFDFGEQPADRYVVSASAPRLTSAQATIDLRDESIVPAPDKLELQLGECRATVFGYVRDSSGGTVEGAHVAEVAQWDWGVGTETDSKGFYELCIRDGRVILAASADGYGTVTISRFGAGRIRLDIVLAPESVIEGVVVRRDDGSPVPGALVELRIQEQASERPASHQVLADSGGRFSVRGVAPGRWLVTGSAANATSSEPLEVVTHAGETSQGNILRLDACARVQGVVSAGGAVLSNVGVSIYVRESGRLSRDAISRSDGTFELSCVPHGTGLVRVAGFETLSPKEAKIEGPIQKIAVDTAAMGTIRGVVKSGAAPVSDADVQYVGGNRAPLPVRTDVSGRFAITGLPPGRYSVSASSQGVDSEPMTLELAAREEKSVELMLVNAASIRGRVLDQDGAPVSDAVVTYTRSDNGDAGASSTDPEGNFVVSALAGSGVYAPTVWVSSGSQHSVEPVSGGFPLVDLPSSTSVAEADLRVSLQRDSVSGIVTDGDGQGVPDAIVSAALAGVGQQPRFVPWLPSPRAITDQEGRFAITKLVRGTYALRATTARGGEVVAHGISTPASDVQLVLQGPAQLEGTLEGFSSRPVIVFIQVADGSSDNSMRATVDGSTFRIRDVPPGRYVVTAQSLSEGASATIEMRANSVTRVNLRSAGSATIKGRVVDFRTGTPIPGERCNVLARSGDWLGKVLYTDTEETDSQGAFAFANAPAGDIAVACVGNAGLYSTAQVATRAEAGETVVLDLPAVRINGPLGDIMARPDYRRVVPIMWLVTPSGSAAQAGLRQGDRIVSVDGTAVSSLSPHGVLVLISNRPSGQKASIEILRGSEKHVFEVVVR